MRDWVTKHTRSKISSSSSFSSLTSSPSSTSKSSAFALSALSCFLEALAIITCLISSTMHLTWLSSKSRPQIWRKQIKIKLPRSSKQHRNLRKKMLSLRHWQHSIKKKELQQHNHFVMYANNNWQKDKHKLTQQLSIQKRWQPSEFSCDNNKRGIAVSGVSQKAMAFQFPTEVVQRHLYSQKVETPGQCYWSSRCHTILRFKSKARKTFSVPISQAQPPQHHKVHNTNLYAFIQCIQHACTNIYLRLLQASCKHVNT